MAPYLAIKEIRTRMKSSELPLFRPGKVVSLDKKKASALFTAGKAKQVKPETALLDTYCRLCSDVVKKIDNEYYPQALGWISWLKKHNLYLWVKIENAKFNLESPLERGVNLKQYSKLAKRWERLLRRGIEVYLKDKSKEEYETPEYTNGFLTLYNLSNKPLQTVSY